MKSRTLDSRGAQCDWVQTAIEVEAAVVKPEGNKGEDNTEDSSPSSNGGKEVAHTIGSSDSDDKPVRTNQSTGIEMWTSNFLPNFSSRAQSYF